jgi:hypothetical protein
VKIVLSRVLLLDGVVGMYSRIANEMGVHFPTVSDHTNVKSIESLPV